ncbi:hypothetical protein JQ607_34325 [Bradyrhizobium liaoningense]|uniref:hypothetical protein n=1 Tax=Bradyrhizobium liaoningense TaxID=43992 RepID=UPI001BAD947C|nr:hypothetical protein [Bradyrhizobium liaoningense]MBR0845292.1 hypothetical protein [Bradyrhizobium liaoningense]MBR0858869.1 hypothetical protein [Bradyrhizobium liaoningense]
MAGLQNHLMVANCLYLVDGNPIDDIRLVEDPEKNFVVIMKDGRIYRNRLAH